MSEDMKDTIGSDGSVAIHCQADTVAVIVTYNRKNLLEQCIEAVLQQTKSCDLLVVVSFEDSLFDCIVSKRNLRIHGAPYGVERYFCRILCRFDKLSASCVEWFHCTILGS